MFKKDGEVCKLLSKVDWTEEETERNGRDVHHITDEQWEDFIQSSEAVCEQTEEDGTEIKLRNEGSYYYMLFWEKSTGAKAINYIVPSHKLKKVIDEEAMEKYQRSAFLPN